MHAAPLALAALLIADPAPAAPSAGPGAPPPAAPSPDRAWGEPPAGSTPEDAALWRRLHAATNDAVMTMGRVGQCAHRLRYGGYAQGLDAVEQASRGERAARAAELRVRLSRAAREADAAIPKEGLRVRQCRATLLDLEQRMDALDDPKLAAGMPEARREAERCAEEVGGFARALEPRAGALEAALDAVDLFLGRAAPASRSAPAPGEPRDPAP